MTNPEIPAGTWTIDPSHSEVGFSVRHLMVSKVKGNFETFEGTITIAEDPLASSVTAEVDLSSINTRDEGRDGHLKSADFFEVENHPKLTFTSTSVEPSGSDFKVTGDLTIKGTTKSVVLDLEFNGVHPDPWGGTRAGFSAETEISRKEFGVDFEIPMDGGGVVVGDKIKVILEVEAVLAS
ncbi:YceI family protein [Aquihabitans sp. G128]|uniref:YceI family protein n=1 Tax=Aquihabitans sp. G128 TaxID=2849779 RepID=UPI001C239AA1|nr:YceI family protein [Aquihabitans sp. G128]QXC59547.1 YceI family protein [Aquihabitans sp. G128]